MRSMHLDFAPLQSSKSRPCRVLPLAWKRRAPSDGDRLGATREMRDNVFYFLAWSVGLEFANARPVHVRSFHFFKSIPWHAIHPWECRALARLQFFVPSLFSRFPLHRTHATFLLRVVLISHHTSRLFHAAHGSAAGRASSSSFVHVSPLARLVVSVASSSRGTCG